jgi:hypothetical protein
VTIRSTRASFAVVRSSIWAHRMLAAGLTAIVLTACGGSDKVTAPPTPASITISAPSGQTAVGETLQFTATVKDASGNTIDIAPTWSVLHGGGTINSHGVFTAGDSAATFANTVVATSGSVSSSGSTVTVLAGPLAVVNVTPATIALAPGATQQFVAAGADSHGNAVAITDRVWAVVAAGGTIDTSGLFTAGATAGAFANTVTATSGAISGTASVTVGGGPVASIEITLDTTTLGIGGTHQYIVTGRDANNNIVPVVPAPVWSVVAGGGTIDASTGLFTAGTVAGTFPNTIHVVSGTFSASTTVTVAAGEVATILVTPDAPSLTAGAVQQFSAIGKDSHDNVVTITPTWSVAAGGGAIDQNGLFTAGTTAGTFTNTVTATSGSISGTASVTISGGTVTSMTLTPSTATLDIGATQQYTVVAKDVNNNVVSVTPTWSVAAGGGTIDNAGLFTAGTVAGTFTNTVTATSGAVSATATVVVSPGPVTSYVITPTPVSVAAGATQQFTAVAKDANNNVVPVTTNWTVGSPGGGTIDGNGLFTAGTVTGTYTNTIVATSGTLAATATVTVTAGPLATITITPLTSTVAKSTGVVNFNAVGKDANGNVVTITPVWTLSSPSAGTITPSGLFHAGTVLGTYTVTATVGTIFGTATVTLQ